MSSQIPLERVSWSVYCPFPKIRAYAEFSFAEKSRKNGARYPKLRGRNYTSNRYDSPQEVLTLDLDTDDYLIFRHADHKDEIEGKVVMSYPHLRRFLDGLAQALEVARDGCFEQVGKSLAWKLTEKGESVETITHIEDMHGGASIALQPALVIRGRDGNDGADGTERTDGEPGMRLYLNGWDWYADVGLDDYVTFVDFYERFDLFATARSAVVVAVTQLGGVPGAASTRTTAPQPARRAGMAPASALGATRKIGAGAR